MDSNKLPIIIDLGSNLIKVGFSGEQKPRLTINNYIGDIKYKKVLRIDDNENKEKNIKYIGEDCDNMMGLVKLRYPVKHGIFVDENDILHVFNYIFSRIDVKPDELRDHPILVTEPLLNSYINRKNITKTLFDSLDIDKLIFCSQPILSLLSTSNTSGIILESGEGVTQSCVICDGYALPPSYERFDYGGGDITEYMKNLLNKKGCCFDNSTDYRLVQEIKQNSCVFLPIDVDEGAAKKALIKNPMHYYLPDGTNISIREERILAPKILFDPSIIGKEYLGLTDIILSSIDKVNVEIKKRTLDNIMISGGNTYMKGLEAKLNYELKNKLKNEKITVKSIKEPQFSCWLGGSIISTLETFKNMWVTKQEWQDNKNIINIKTI